MRSSRSRMEVRGAGTVIGGRDGTEAPIGPQGSVERYRGSDLESGLQSPMPVVILWEPSAAASSEDAAASWPGIRWERRIVSQAAHLSLPRVFYSFVENGRAVLSEDMAE